MAELGLFGAGIMGTAMLGNLRSAGHSVTVHDPDPARQAAARSLGARIAADGRDVAADAKVIFSSLPSVAALAQMTDALCARALDGVVLVEASTLPITAKRTALARIEDAGGRMLDAPVSGTGAQARTRDLAVLASGDRAAFESALPALHAVARQIDYLGPFGAGMTMKLIANQLVAIHSLAAAEALALGTRAGLPAALIVSVLQQGAGASRMLQVRGAAMAKEQFDPPAAHLDTLIKDIAMIEDLARAVGASTPLFAQAAETFRDAAEQGLGQRDISEIYRIVRERGAR